MPNLSSVSPDEPHSPLDSARSPWTDSSAPRTNSFLERLFQDCRSYLLEIANRETPEELRRLVSPSDLVQETFADAVQTSAQFRGQSQVEFLGWLRKILLHNILDARRYHLETQKRQDLKTHSLSSSHGSQPADHLVSDHDASPSAIYRQEEDTARLRVAIDRLPEHYRLVIKLRHFDGLSLDAVAQELGRSAEAVRKIWFRAIEKLAAVLEDESKADGI